MGNFYSFLLRKYGNSVQCCYAVRKGNKGNYCRILCTMHYK